MSDEFLNQLAKQIALLEAELAETPTYRRLKKAMALYDEYAAPQGGDGLPSSSAEARKDACGKNERSEVKPLRRQRNEATQAILDAVVELLRDADGPMRTSNILAILREQGHEIPGEKALNNLSAMISYSKMFQAHGKSGWTLIEADDADKNTEAADGPNLAGGTSTASSEHRPTSGGTTSVPVEPAQGGGT